MLEGLSAQIAQRPGKVFTRHLLPDGVRELTFAEFAERAGQFAHQLRSEGVTRRDVIPIFLPTSPEALPVFVAAMMLGAIPSFMPCPSVKQHPEGYWESHRRLLDRIGARLLVTDEVHAPDMKLHGLAGAARTILTVEDVTSGARVDPPAQGVAHADDAAFLQHSSGTTALKKGVALSHRAVLAQVDAYAARIGIAPEHNLVSWLPIYHDMGLIACSILPLALGQTVTILDPIRWAARPAALFEAIDRHDGRFCWLPNFAFEHLCRAVPPAFTADLSRLCAFINCSEPCRPATFDRFLERFGPLGVHREQLKVCYAMAETVFAVSQTDLDRIPGMVEVDAERLHGDGVASDPTPTGHAARLLSAGQPLPGLSVEIREGGKVLGENRVGEIVVSGDLLFDAYFNDPATTAEQLREGRYHTRDRGFLRGGELYVLGRIDDLLIVNGRNLHAHEVEALAADVSGLKPGRVAAFGVFNPRIGSEELVIVAERDPAVVADDRTVVRTLRDIVAEQTGVEVGHVRLAEPGWLIKTSSGKAARGANRHKWLDEARRPATAGLGADPGRS